MKYYEIFDGKYDKKDEVKMSVRPLKKGDIVVMHTCMEAEEYDGKIWTCKTDETKLHPSHSSSVVWLEGYSGAFLTKYLQKVNFDELENNIATERR